MKSVFLVAMVTLFSVPVWAQEKPAKSAFTQTFAIPSKGLIRKSEKEDLLRRMNHRDAKPANKAKKAETAKKR